MEAVEQLVQQHAGLVKSIARQLVAHLPSHIEVADLVQAGMIGLIESAPQFDASLGAPFEAYISFRIRGAMLDELRDLDWAPRSVRRNARRVAEATRQVVHRTGRKAADAEIAAELGMDLEQYQGIAADSARTQVVSMTAMMDDEDVVSDIADLSDGPQHVAEREDFENALAEAMDGLPARERQILTLHYAEEIAFREIGRMLGITETRVRQVQELALIHLRKRMTAQKGGWVRRHAPPRARWHERRRSSRLAAALSA